MAKKKKSAAEAAQEIQRLCEEGMTHAQIKKDHPELNDGWAHGLIEATATRPPRGGGAMGASRPAMARP